MPQTLYIDIPNLEPLTLSTDEGDKDGLTFWKELIYVGDFEKGKQEIPVDEALLHHWNQTSARMLSNGVEIPVPAEHSTDPEKRRGSVVAMKVASNKRSIPALFGKIKFKDAKAAELAKTANVSIFADTETKDGLGNVYYHPITHVALTDYPVIPGLGKFEPIAASFIEGKKQMAIDPRKLAEKLGVAADVADSELETAIDSAISELLKKVEGAGKPSGEGDNKPDNKPAPAVAASFGKLLAKTRLGELDALVLSHRLTPAACKALQGQYCKPEQLALSLSQEGAANDDGFDGVVKALSLQEPYLPTKGQSGPQILELSNVDAGDAQKNPLLKNAAQRAAASKQ